MERFLMDILKRTFSIVSAFDRSGPRLLRYFSPERKRALVRKFFHLFASTLARRPREVNGLLFCVPRRLVRYYFISEFEPKTRKIMKHYIQPGMVVVDVGANI